MPKPEIVSVKETAVVQYGIITVRTSAGDIEFSYSTGDDGFVQYEQGNYGALSDDEMKEVDEIVDEAWRSI